MGEMNGGLLWCIASSSQLVIGIISYRRGCGGALMPFKAFGVASLFVGSGATGIMGMLNFAGIHKVEDMKEVGASIREGLGIPQRENK